MQILDSEGKLFGYVNIIDALVVLFVVAVLAAGIALVAGGDAPQSSASAEFATITIGPVSEDTASRLMETDSMSLAGTDQTLNVSDAVQTPDPSRDGAFVFVRVRTLDAADSASLAGEVAVSTGQLNVNGSVDAFGNQSSIQTQASAVTLETTVSDQVATSLSQGDTFELAGDTVGTVTDVRLLGEQDGNRRLRVALDVTAVRNGGTLRFARQPLRLGSSLPFRTDSYGFSGEVVSQSGGIPTAETVTVRAETAVQNSVADSVTAGDTYRVNDRTLAEINSVTAYSVAGSDRQQLSMTLSLETMLEDGTPQFLGTPVRIGSTVPFETSSYQFTGTVVSQNSSMAGTLVDATLEVRWENVSPELANAVTPGMAEQHRGASATITDVEREPATVITRSESGDIFAREHPVNEDVTLTVSARTTRQNGRLTFHGQQVQTGDPVVLDFGSVTVRGTVAGATEDG